jgi:hypothetical protein
VWYFDPKSYKLIVSRDVFDEFATLHPRKESIVSTGKNMVIVRRWSFR